MTKSTFSLLMLSCIINSNNVLSQSFTPKALRFDNQEIKQITQNTDQAGWLFFKPEAKLQPNDLFTTYKEYMGLGEYDEMRLTKSETDEYGIEHNRYQQYYKGKEVEGAEYYEHIKDCIIWIANGKLLENYQGSDIPLVSESQALGIALNAIGANTYLWQDTTAGINDSEETGDSLIYTIPEGKLIFGQINQDDILPENYQLVWRFEIISTDPGAINEVYINAQNGEILKLQSMGSHNGPADLLYNYNTQTIDTKYHNGFFNDYHYLNANDNTRNILTRKGTYSDHGGKWKKYDDVKDDNDDWGMASSNSTTAHWIVCQSWDYFRQVHNRIGWDGNGGQIKVLSNSNYNDSQWIPVDDLGWLEFGKTPDGKVQVTLDIGGHEFAHGLIHQLSGLSNSGRSGALNESFADIFGILVNRFAFPQNFTWVFGDLVHSGTGYERSLENPGSIIRPQICDRPAAGYPNVFEGERWYFGGCDAGGVHINCGPQNRWFYLLSEGGLEQETGISVQGIGIDKAAKIVYYSLSHFIQKFSRYPDARQAAIASAITLYGHCSFEVEQVTNAWAAVGVGDVYNNNCISIEGPLEICLGEVVFPQVLGLPKKFHAYAPQGAIITWNVPSTWTHSFSGPGNNTLIVQNIIPIPPNGSTVNISATASTGGTAFYNVSIYSDCYLVDPICPDGERSDEKIVVKNNLENGKIIAYPNPVSNFLFFKSDEPLNLFDITITDIVGRSILTRQKLMADSFIDVSGLDPGLYILHISNSNIQKNISIYKN